MPADAVQALTKAVLRASEAFGLKHVELAQILGVPHEVVEQFAAGSQHLQPGSDASTKAWAVIEIFDRLTVLMGSDSGTVRTWISSFNHAFAVTPRERLQQPDGADAVLSYLYRKSALYAVAAKYKVRAADGTLVGELYNASYLLLPLSPGKHQFSVDEGGFTKPKSFEVDVKPGQNYFVEYDSSKGLLLGWGLLSDSAVRSEAQALGDLKGLNRAN